MGNSCGDGGNRMIDQWLAQLAGMIENTGWFAPMLAFVAGILTSVTPCALSSVPLIVGYVGGIGTRNTKRAFAYSVVFAAGTAITFVVLGMIATSAGRLMGKSSRIWYLILGSIMVLMALQTWEIVNLIPSASVQMKNQKKGFIGAFLAGILGGIFSSPCATPVLIVLLGVLASNGNLLWGILLMLLYSLGHSTLVIVSGTSLGFVQRLNQSTRYKTAAKVLKILMGTAILFIGLYMFWLAF